MMIMIETQMVTKMWLMSLILSRDLPSCLPPPTSVERYIAVPLSATEQYLISSSGQVENLILVTCNLFTFTVICSLENT